MLTSGRTLSQICVKLQSLQKGCLLVVWDERVPKDSPRKVFYFFARVFVCGCAYEGMCVHMYMYVCAYVQAHVHVC